MSQDLWIGGFIAVLWNKTERTDPITALVLSASRYIYRRKVPKFRDALPRTGSGGFELAHAAFYFACIVSALEYVHSLGVAYRDVSLHGAS